MTVAMRDFFPERMEVQQAILLQDATAVEIPFGQGNQFRGGVQARLEPDLPLQAEVQEVDASRSALTFSACSINLATH
jgi:hypothetical protein